MGVRRVVFTQKGGVGKSSIACNLAAISASRGMRTLVLDLDVQGNATEYLLGRRPEDLEDTIEGFFEQTLGVRLRKGRNPADFVHKTPFDNLSVMPAGAGLDMLVQRLEARQKIYKLRDALRMLDRSFERIYVDTPPAINFYTRSALIAADRCIVPFDCDSFSRRALYQVLETINELREDHNPALYVEGIVINQFQSQANLPQRLRNELVEEGLPVLETALSASVKMRESHDAGVPLVHLAPKHKLTQQLIELHDALESNRSQSRLRAAAVA